jgi:hypothetical protein
MAQFWLCSRGCGFSTGDPIAYCNHMTDTNKCQLFVGGNGGNQAHLTPPSQYQDFASNNNRMRTMAQVPFAHSQLKQSQQAAAEPTNSMYRQHGNYFFAAGLNGGQTCGEACIPTYFIIVRGDKQPLLTKVEKEQRLAAMFGTADKELIFQHRSKMEILEIDLRSFIATRFRSLFSEHAQEWRQNNPTHPFKSGHRSFAIYNDVCDEYAATDCKIFHNAVGEIFRLLKTQGIYARMENDALEQFGFKYVPTGPLNLPTTAKRGTKQAKGGFVRRLITELRPGAFKALSTIARNKPFIAKGAVGPFKKYIALDNVLPSTNSHSHPPVGGTRRMYDQMPVSNGTSRSMGGSFVGEPNSGHYFSADVSAAGRFGTAHHYSHPPSSSNNYNTTLHQQLLLPNKAPPKRAKVRTFDESEEEDDTTTLPQEVPPKLARNSPSEESDEGDDQDFIRPRTLTPVLSLQSSSDDEDESAIHVGLPNRRPSLQPSRSDWSTDEISDHTNDKPLPPKSNSGSDEEEGVIDELDPSITDSMLFSNREEEDPIDDFLKKVSTDPAHLQSVIKAGQQKQKDKTAATKERKQLAYRARRLERIKATEAEAAAKKVKKRKVAAPQILKKSHALAGKKPTVPVPVVAGKKGLPSAINKTKSKTNLLGKKGVASAREINKRRTSIATTANTKRGKLASNMSVKAKYGSPTAVGQEAACCEHRRFEIGTSFKEEFQPGYPHFKEQVCKDEECGIIIAFDKAHLEKHGRENVAWATSTSPVYSCIRCESWFYCNACWQKWATRFLKLAEDTQNGRKSGRKASGRQVYDV